MRCRRFKHFAHAHALRARARASSTSISLSLNLLTLVYKFKGSDQSEALIYLFAIIFLQIEDLYTGGDQISEMANKSLQVHIQVQIFLQIFDLDL